MSIIRQRRNHIADGGFMDRKVENVCIFMDEMIRERNMIQRLNDNGGGAFTMKILVPCIIQIIIFNSKIHSIERTSHCAHTQ